MGKSQFFGKQSLIFLLIFFNLFFLCFTDNKQSSIEAMQKLTPFIGKWQTLSIYPISNLKVPGQLEYRWVLGKNWILVEFVGQHPEREFWEAYALIKFDAARNRYISYDFFNALDPIIMTGHWISEKTIRFEVKDNESSSGIDYTINRDGTIFQENWICKRDQKRKITLKTNYKR